MSTPDVVHSRAHWQRTEATFAFDLMFRKHFPELLDQVDTRVIADVYREADDPLVTALAAAHHISSQKINKAMSPVNFRIPDEVKFTHAGANYAMNEAVRSTVFFPVNILAVANSRRPESIPNLAPDLGAIATAFQQPYFGRICETAAFTANGTWGTFSTHATPKTDHLPFTPGGEPFDYFDTPTGSGFDFSDITKAFLLGALRRRNRLFYAGQRDGLNIKDNDLEGTTSGCPVTRTTPHFTNHPHDQARLQSMASFHDMTPEQITAPHTESTIVFGVRSFGKLLEQINANVVSG